MEQAMIARPSSIKAHQRRGGSSPGEEMELVLNIIIAGSQLTYRKSLLFSTVQQGM